MKKWINYIVTCIIVTSIIFISFYFVLIAKNLGFLITSLHNKIEIYEQYRQEELNELKGMIERMVTLTIKNDKSQIKINNIQQDEIENLTKFLIAFNQIIKENNKTQLITIGIINSTIKKLATLQKEILGDLNRTKKIDLDNVEKIKEANISVYNRTAGVNGSGSHIIIKDKHYILTCAHLVKSEEEDYVWGVVDESTWHPLGLIKINRKKDLALFEIFMVDDLPYLEISDEFPKEGSEIVLIGNPDILKDIITDGIIAKINKKSYIFTNKMYFGNSGGAIIYKGKIVGVANQIGSSIQGITFINYGYGIKLETIKEFLDIK